ncbi:HI0074 family nucleotidyltransferase substrate-binding subunit [Shewanella glacialimarina]|uniref:HI0074 family nucleotidyltransferase substrate-binding subunit n=1 Tax=Shewanella glacialimarina TaxID=2590884 RepID=UPI001CF84404|nr:HI0074 family nucleotidyltransferase substrate-binding subunit [Shewanella glacialimarina]UCX05010.1 nucleotidyltransferase [Shewanella glacialimarina]
MSNPRKLLDSLGNFRKAVDKLEQALQIPKDRELVVEGTIQRFETVVELVWKTLKRGLKYEGIHPNSPRESMVEGFAIGWLNEEIVWQDLLDHRNKSSHEYLDDDFIEEYYDEIKVLFKPIKELLEFLENRYESLLN